MVTSSQTGAVILAREPCILATITCDGGQILKVTLSDASSFSYKIVNANPKLAKTIVDWLKGYAKGEDHPFPIDLKVDTFTDRVLDFLPRIPLGKVVAYQEVAKILGNPKGSRAVGNACRSNRYPLLIPCHRVVGSNGALGGYTPWLEIKKRLLKFEGVL